MYSLHADLHQTSVCIEQSLPFKQGGVTAYLPVSLDVGLINALCIYTVKDP